MSEIEAVELTRERIDETPILAALEKLENYVDASCWRMIQAAKREHLCGSSAPQIEMMMEGVRADRDERYDSEDDCRSVGPF